MPRLFGLPFSSIAICGVVIIANLGSAMVAPVLPSIRDDFGSSAAEVALMVSGFGLGRLATDLPAGFLTERVGATRMFTVGILLTGVASALAAFSGSLQQLIIFRVGMGFGSAIVTTTALVLLTNSARPENRGKVLSLYSSAGMLGSAVSPYIGGFLGSLSGWRSVFLFCALTPLVSLPLNLLITAPAARRPGSAALPGNATPSRAAPRALSAREAARANLPALITMFVATFFCFFNREGWQAALLPLYGAAVLGMDPAAIGAVLSSRAVFTIFASLPAAALGDRIGKKRLLIPGMLMLIAGDLYLLADENLFVFTASTFLVSMGILANNMLAALIADQVPERHVGRAMGMYRFTCDLGWVAGPFALGLVVDRFGFAAASLLSAGMILPAMAGCMLLVPHRTARAMARGAARP